ncbi:SGNH/GDSL hydrolase family protein [Sphingomonas glacialis]|uniref:SGNH/GDSL hydrolase family protein n=1 Tax=Sphingomonas glacialis TaxID=658225 RepID=A0A502FX53_9SPHN|nr:SGNH/GDSL hydrolase family protein [Sphingomonas glacialis]TPG53862.1 SGNH/GDSL hydrolase family protein [Sphingomonas glacialis]
MIVRSLAAMLALTLPALASASPAAQCAGRWTASWASSQKDADHADTNIAAKLRDATLRQTVRLSRGGDSVRIRLSNLVGTAPLTIDSVHVALAEASGSPSIRAGSDQVVTFGGRRQVSIPAGAEYRSDPITLAAPDRATLSISLHLPEAPSAVTSHPGSRTGSFIVSGNHAGDTTVSGERVEHWYFASGVDVAGCGSAIVALGDSITDGRGATTDRDDRWTNVLAARLPAGSGLSLVNHGIGGNRVLRDGLGPNALARLDRDVLAQPGVRYLIVLEGVNDLGVLTRDHPVTTAEHEALVADLEQGYRQIVNRAHDHGVKVIGATILPYGGSAYYHPGAAGEADRVAVNDWIRRSGVFDTVVDFDAVMRDPAHPERLAPAFDSGDGLHPSPAGYARMGQAVPIAAFR